MRLLRNFLIASMAITFASCQAVPPTKPVGVTDLEQHYADVKAKEQSLAKLAASLKTKAQQLKTREQSLTHKEQRLREDQQAIENERRSLQRAEFNARLVPEETPVAQSESLLVGELEKVFLSPPGETLDARIDTGKAISELNIVSSTEFERDGKPYVNFKLRKPNSSDTLEVTRRVRDQVRIKGTNGKTYRRHVVRMRVVLGSIDERVNFVLRVQPEQKTMVTIGRNVLRDLAIVDVSKQFVTAPQL